MLNKVPNQLPWYHENLLMNFLSWCHLFGAISPWIGSFIYHLFMNMKNDEKFYTRLLKLDMLGIWICQSVGNDFSSSINFLIDNLIIFNRNRCYSYDRFFGTLLIRFCLVYLYFSLHYSQSLGPHQGQFKFSYFIY